MPVHPIGMNERGSVPKAWRLSMAALVCLMANPGYGAFAVPSASNTLTATIAVRTGAPAYYSINRKWRGVDHDLMRLLTRDGNIHFKVVTVDTAVAALNALRGKKAHLAAGFIAAPPLASRSITVLPAYDTVVRQVLHHYESPGPKSLNDIPHRQLDVGNYPAHRLPLPLDAGGDGKTRDRRSTAIELITHNDMGARGMLSLLDQKFIDYTLGDSSDVLIHQYDYPRIQAAFNLPGELPVAWLARTDIDPQLLYRLTVFFRTIRRNNMAEHILNRYFQHIRELPYGAKLTFMGNADVSLRKHRPLFIKMGALFGLDWQLLAAISYQESHWDDKAVSPSHTKGLMMLTKPVIEEYQVHDPFDARANIAAGGRYFLNLRNRLPPEVQEPDRTWLALAAYNIGMRFVLNAREMARRAGKNPDWWMHVREFLGKAQKRSRAPLRNDAKKYVHDVLLYRDLVIWFEQQVPMTP